MDQRSVSGEPVKTGRNRGLDVLRIVLMFLVVCHHVCTQGGVLNAAPVFSGNYYASWALVCLTYCAVDCFALLSGYVGYGAPVRYFRIVKLYLGVLFYHVGFFMIFCALDHGNFSVMAALKAFTPALSGQNWYFSAYFALFFFIPYINKAMRSMTVRDAGRLTLAAIVVFSVLPTLRHTDPFVTGQGYSTLWLTCMYVLGAYLRKSGFFEKASLNLSVTVFVTAWAVAIGSKLVIEAAMYRFTSSVAGGGLLIEYTSPVIILEAVALACIMSKLRLNNDRAVKFVRTVSASMFYVLIIHENYYIKHTFIKDRYKDYAAEAPATMLFHIIVTALVIFTASALIDIIRAFVFKVTAIDALTERIYNKSRNKLKKKCSGGS